jgi:hypothetical protein
MKRIATLLIIMTIAGSAVGQNQFSGKVRISKWRDVKRVDKFQESKQLNVGDEVKSEFTYTNAGVTYTVERSEKVGSVRNEMVDQVKNVNMKGLDGFANISPDKDKPNRIKVSYWLNPVNSVDSGTKILDEEFEWTSATATSMTPKSNNPTAPNALTADTRYYLQRLEPDEYTNLVITENWVKNTPRRVTVLDTAGKVDYYLIDKYVSEAEYFIPVMNREYLRFNASNWDIGAITVPFKIRTSYTHTRADGTEINVPMDIGSDFNVGLFGGWSYGTERYRFESGEMKKLSNLKLTIGAFLSLGKQDLDSLSTTASDKPFVGEDKRSMMITSLGAGVMASFFDIKLALFIGTDLGTGEYSGRWNHHAKPWIGIGFGYNLAGLLSKKE